MKVFEASAVAWWLPTGYIALVSFVDVYLRGSVVRGSSSKKRGRNRVVDDDSQDTISAPLLPDSGKDSILTCAWYSVSFGLSISGWYNEDCMHVDFIPIDPCFIAALSSESACFEALAVVSDVLSRRPRQVTIPRTLRPSMTL